MKYPKLREIKEALKALATKAYTSKFPYVPHIPFLTFRGKPYFYEDDCVGCGTCIEKCNTKALELIDGAVKLNDEKCLGCGVCAHLCPQNAIKLERIEPKTLYIPPPRLKN